MLLYKGEFSLSKWASTVPELLQGARETADSLSIAETDSESIKILGMRWMARDDSFTYTVRSPASMELTKRSMLSVVSRLYDPLGLVSPTVFLAKALIQDVWKARLDWDDPLPPGIAQECVSLIEDMKNLSKLRIPRHIASPVSDAHLIGFCDASTKGYAAAIYWRSKGPDGIIKATLIKAKTKVAPLKHLSVARLELCGALLLARLAASINSPSLKPHDTVCYTDSAVVLAWLRTPTHKLSVFEANRVTDILDIVPADNWRHVKSKENPADIASRGSLPSQLLSAGLWWNGPPWLTRDEALPAPDVPVSSGCCLIVNEQETRMRSIRAKWMNRFSSFRLLVCTTVRILRLFERQRRNGPTVASTITADDYQKAKLKCIELVQHDALPLALYSGERVPKEFRMLTPFLDEAGIVRVGGRLHNAPIAYTQRHPILMPRNSHVTRLIVDDVHVKHFHAGPSLAMALLRSEFWIPGALRLIKGRILSCTHCRILRAKPTPPFMGSLPPDRFSIGRAFLQVGVDYAGPFIIKDSKLRKASTSKAYLCLFVCMATKALHLEVVSTLETGAFLSALDRFVARRGLPQTMWSDNGTNFVGASRFLKDLYLFISKSERELTETLAHRGIEWKFIPPRAPHFGGLWEAGVRSVKKLLLGALGRRPCTFEEMTTILVKIEGLLNSRPLCAMSDSANEYEFLTPGHFLVGGPLTALPTPTEVEYGSLTTRWDALQAQISSVWNRWRRDYLHTLQQRTKWWSKRPNLKVDDLVIMVEKKSQLGQWPVGRVDEVFPGKDGMVRVVAVRNPSGTRIVRATNLVVPLFLPESNENSGATQEAEAEREE